ncbi:MULTISPECIES: MliC family protein [unclassified Saccharibacter]|uniref:MliC family protein n=1 Tax=unclassified Saccharibacter TaxID=2648722 RepID=UPI001321530F|nr:MULTISPECIES: MliC family protein [unclassified Saccharibacter]MXV36686.1 hypothetical protein [Saccharibacter sp. EH611]MXV58754.1 hypothetical protein [Saccharibacter sp. EH70]MXV65634.1 hypothetical protein [Saccharibacter sp. EH60]
MKSPFLMGCAPMGLALLVGSAGCAYAAQQSSAHHEKSPPNGVMMVPLHHGEASNRQDVIYHCTDNDKKDEHGGKDLLKSLPDGGRFTASYLNADMTALAVLPVDGNMLAMANVISGSGAKYVADRYSWATQGDEATFSRVDRDDMSVSCRVVSEAVDHSKAEAEGPPSRDAQPKAATPVQQRAGGTSSSSPAKTSASSHQDNGVSTSRASVVPSSSSSHDGGALPTQPSSSQDTSKNTQQSQH